MGAIEDKIREYVLNDWEEIKKVTLAKSSKIQYRTREEDNVAKLK